MFGTIAGAGICDLNIVNCDITGDCYVGDIAGEAVGSAIDNCTVSGKMTGSVLCGGIAGSVSAGGRIENCTVSAEIDTSRPESGGITGLCNNGSIKNCFVRVECTGAQIGGICGKKYASAADRVYCSVCGALISREYIAIDILDCDWGDPVYVWSDDNRRVTATRTSKTDPTITESETSGTTFVEKLATTTETGSITYTAVFAKPAFTVQTKVIVTPVKMDDYEMPVYVWTEDLNSVTATRVCRSDPDKTVTETVSTTRAQTSPAACESGSLTTVTAKFESTASAIR